MASLNICEAFFYIIKKRRTNEKNYWIDITKWYDFHRL